MRVMEARVDAIIAQDAPGLIWLLEHPPLYTAGSSARSEDLLAEHHPVYETGRGGQYTYHGPGQRVVYIMVDLKKIFAGQAPDLRKYIQLLEQWIILVLADLNVEGFLREGRVGVWVKQNNSEAKIAAIGVRVKKWVAYHGFALNVQPDLSHYAGIVPCGIREYGVTSLQELGIKTDMQKVDDLLKKHCPFTMLGESKCL